MIANTELTVELGSGILFGIICALIASGRGRSGIGWFILGFFLTCIALIILLLIPDLNVENAKSQRQRAELRKLREQVKKERHVADERHTAQRERLDAHDRALGIDTSAADQRLVGAGMAPPPLPAATDSPSDLVWFHADDGERHGPIADAELRQMLRYRRIEPDTLVWRQGMDEWQPANDLPELFGDLPA
ncbi:MAG: DUF4339 domain-containing protein [Planctomycetes bacterium]|nr:DUF4339 domain-containing protein [Planctomycetota bacterium]